MIDYGTSVYLDAITAIPLETQRLWRNDYRIRQWTRQNDVLSWFDQENWKESLRLDKTRKMYSVFNRDHEGIGVCGLTDLNLVDGKAEFSLYIAPAFHGQGYGKDALKTLVSHGFNTYRLNVIWGESFEHNPAAKMFVHLGFKLVGSRRHFYFRDGRSIDAHMFDILRSEWQKSDVFHGYRTQKCSS